MSNHAEQQLAAAKARKDMKAVRYWALRIKRQEASK